MYLYTIIEALVAVVVGIFIAVCSKKAEGVTYTKLDKAGRITNILLIPVYVCLAPLYMFLGMISYPDYGGFLGILGWIVSIINASAVGSIVHISKEEIDDLKVAFKLKD